ncbi:MULTISPECIES: DUF2975 domain-containing protein [unclassified Modestobacter]|uniref:DUF2975 domain-containing protein n=1 Tax=unclassified Modestobacter TaxID=2643866 RepID=UPI0022AA2EF2|nr:MULTISPECIES: DUF2975 domain-containing protein [unclassified Modestobacter]MCZ2823967.1 DUF2975 domain-containing protein [Modestobacter sp. VKM Ac-2981]MCZ2852212.1 DUF2975 domain-containing protein [Modestobacter sp. VKM Ac-2982]
MPHVHPLVLPIRFLLALLFTALVAAQIWVAPGMLPDLADPSLEQSLVRGTMFVASIVGLACVQVVVVCTWKLLTMVRRDCIFSTSALPWVDAIVVAMVVGWLMLLGAFVSSYYFVIDEVSDDPGPPALLLVLLLVGAVVGLLMAVMRALLLQATTLRSDMEAVI